MNNLQPHKSPGHTQPSQEEYHSLLDQDYTVGDYYYNYQLHNEIGYPGSGYNRKYKYDTTRVPPCAVTNNKYYNLTFCLQDQQYPR